MDNKALRRLSEIAAHPYQYAREWKAQTGGRVFGYFCSYFPEEVLHAAGLLPMRILGYKENVSLADSHIQAFICSLVRTSLDAALKKKLDFLDGVVFPHSCDSIQNLADIWHYNFPNQFLEVVVLPVWVDAPEAEQYLTEEINRFRKKLEAHLGKQIPDEKLRKSIDIYDENRAALAELYALRRERPRAISGQQVMDVVRSSMCMRKEEHTALVRGALGQLRSFPPKNDGAVRLVLYGNVCDDPGIMNLFDELEAIVVDDDLCTGSRYFLHSEPSDGDPISRISRRYLRKIPCPSKHTTTFDRRKYLVDMVNQSKADGVVMLILKFCDPHSFDYPDIAKRLTESSIPHVLIETEIQPTSIEQVRTRLQAFIEMLKEKKNG